MLKTGEWLSLSIIGLVIIFIILTISFFTFLIGPDYKGPQTTIEPSSSFIQIIFISIGPAIALSFFTKDFSKLSSILLIISGIILIISMIYVIPLISQIKNIEIPIWISNVPFIFTGFGILLFSIGLINFKKSKRKRKSTFDLN